MRDHEQSSLERLMRVSARVSQAAWLVTWALALLSPSLQGGLFVVGATPIAVRERTFSVGPLHLVLLGAACAGALAFALLGSRRRLAWGAPATSLPVLGFGLLTLMRIWPVHDPRVAWVAAGATLVFWAAYVQALQGIPMIWVANALSLVCLLQGSVALGQGIVQRSLGLAALGETTLDPQTLGVSVVASMGQRWLRAYGLMAHPNLLGGYLSLMMCVVTGVVLDRWRDPPARGWRLWMTACLAVALAGLALTFSRSAWLGTLAGAILLAGQIRLHTIEEARRRTVRRPTWLLLGLLAVAAALSLGAPLLRSRLLVGAGALEASSLSERIIDAGLAWELIRAAPLAGVGPGYYVAALWAHIGNKLEPGYPGFRVVHNIPLLAAAELGLGGAALWLWMVGGPVWTTIRGARRRHLPSAQVGLAAALLSALVIGLFDKYLYIPVSWRPALSLGLLLGLWSREHGRFRTGVTQDRAGAQT